MEAKVTAKVEKIANRKPRANNDGDARETPESEDVADARASIRGHVAHECGGDVAFLVGDAAASEKYDNEEDQPGTQLVGAAVDRPMAVAEVLDETIVGALVERCLGGDPPDDLVGDDQDDLCISPPCAATPGPEPPDAHADAHARLVAGFAGLPRVSNPEVPAGCTLTAITPTGRAPHWVGRLPLGCTFEGTSTITRAWATIDYPRCARTTEAAYQICLQWLQRALAAGATQPAEH